MRVFCLRCGPGTVMVAEPSAGRLRGRRLVGPIHFASLDCPDEVLASRLRARPAWRGTSSESAIAQHQRFAAWLRSNIRPTFDTSNAGFVCVSARIR